MGSPCLNFSKSFVFWWVIRAYLLSQSVAQLGGFLRRASDGPPGWQTLWEGWLRLRWYVAGMRFAAHAHHDTFARSPCTNG